MADKQQQEAKAFVEYWKDKGYEKGQSQPFWLSLLRSVYGVGEPEKFIEFEDTVHLDNTSFIDGMIPSTKVMIEQKGRGKDLNKAIRQSDGSLLTPFQQAKRYITELPLSQHPRWVVTCNFEEFHVYDMERPGGDPEVILLKNLPEEYYRLQFLVDFGNEHIETETEISVAAGEIVGLLYDAFSKQYADPNSEHSLHSLNVLCVRLVFCLYAENGGIFGRYGMFHDYLEDFETRQMRRALEDLFRILDTPTNERNPYLADDNPKLAEFPYVNGGLFSDENNEIPPFTDEIRDLLLEKASAGFNWAEISPTIFGAVFESTLNPETRRSGGMHYTSIENIHKVIDPLFLDDLKNEFAEIRNIPVERTRARRLDEFQKKLSSLEFLDPACGSGNFLTETYLSLRRLENDVLRELMHGQMSFGLEGINPIQVSLNQFYGIEINDFAVTVAKTALWIAESQMMQETESIVMMDLDFLPLKSYTNIVEGNALRMDWNDVVPREKLNYIMGNPPFVGYSLQSKEQKADILSVYVDEKGKPYKAAGKIDYVSGWYFKASHYMAQAASPIRAAFVSTNSITQGEQVANVWKPLRDRFGVHIDFAHRTFRWDSEASLKAHVHCVIIGFSTAENNTPRRLFSESRHQEVENVNFYLMPMGNIFIEARNRPVCDVPLMCRGFQPTENGNLILNEEEKNELIRCEPDAEKWIHPFSMGAEFIKGTPRYCLWLTNITPHELRNLPEIEKRVSACRKWREAQVKTGDAYKLKDIPHLFRPIKGYIAKSFIAIPKVSSERRRYIPMGYLPPEMIPGDKLFIIQGASLYHFGVLTSNVHMAWMRAVCGRLEMRYSYSSNVVYNDFPWPTPTDVQRARIEETAQAILDARALYPDSSLADLYDELTMPPELRRAHQANDKAVMEAYGFTKGTEAYASEAACVAELMKMYQSMTSEEE